MGRKIKVIIIITVITIILGGAREARAQGLSLSISPPSLEVFIKPGKSITQVYKIKNSGEQVILSVKIGEFDEFGLQEDPNFTAEPWLSSLTPDIVFNRPFVLAPGAERQMILRVNPPVGTKELDYYRAVVFTTKPLPAQDFSQSQISQTIAAPVLITVTTTGLLEKIGKITKFEVPDLVDSFGPLELNLELKNEGNTYFHPVGKLILTGTVGKGEFNLVPNAILAGQTRRLTTESQLATSHSDKTLTLPGFFIGKYKLTADFTLDQGSMHITSEKIFYALPIKATIGLIFVVFIVVMISKGGKKK